MEENGEERARRERTAMDLVRDNVARVPEAPPKWTLQKLLALGAALLLSTTLFLGFDFFLTAMQKFMEIEVKEEATPSSEPMTVFAVPEDDSSAAVAGGSEDAEPWLPSLELDADGTGREPDQESKDEGPGRPEPPGR